MSPERQLAEHAAAVGVDTVSDDAIERAKYLLLDHLGIAIRASDSAVSSPSVRDAVSDLDGVDGSATVLGTGETAPPEYAALLNGTFSHSLELDDTHREGSLHPGVAVVPAALATAERRGSTGADLLAGIVAGYDVMVRVGKAATPSSQYARGFHPTATCGVFGAIAAAGNLAGRSADELTDALGVGVSQASGTMQYLENGAWNKRVHPGLAARSGLLADALAGNGFLGAREPLTGDNGFFTGYTVDPRPEKLTADLGDVYEVTETGIKPYACCRAMHGAIDAALALRDRVELDEIERIDVEIYETGMGLVSEPLDRKRRPENVVDAQFSLPYGVAVALSENDASLDAFSEENITDPTIQSLMDRVHPSGNAEYEAAYPSEWPSTVRIETANETVSSTVSYPLGEPENPLSWDEISEKFTGLVENRVSDPESVVRVVRSLDERPVDDLVDAL